MPDNFDLTIVIPVHNEAGFISPAVQQIVQLVEPVFPNFRIILVENGSTDDTAAQGAALSNQNPRIEVVQLPQANYGAAVRQGMEQAGRAGWVVLFDIDFYSGDFVQQVRNMEAEADVIIASKRGPGSTDHRSPLRRLATRVFSGLVRQATGSRLSDTHGIKALRGQVVQALIGQVQQSGDLFDTELVIRAERAGYRVREVPILVQELRPSRSSLMRRVPRTLWGVYQIRRSLRRERVS